MKILLLLLAYLIGSLSFAIIICKLFRLPDPRTQGSGNPGATNVLRISNKKMAALVLLGDGLKGFLPVYIAKTLYFPLFWQAMVALAAVAGHVFPLFFKFKGGKGVATFLGAILAFTWPLGVMLLMVWFLITKIFRFSSLAAIITVICAPFFTLLFYRFFVDIPIILMSVLVLYRHKTNMTRLVAGNENQLGEKK